MTLADAEKIVQEFGAALSRDNPNDGPASCASRLPHSPHTIVQAMKLWLAHDIQNGSLTEEFRNQIATAASMLLRFIEDKEARRLNTSRRSADARTRFPGLSAEEFKAAFNAIREVDDWALNATLAGSSLRRDLSDFIATVEQFDPTDPLYWQRVYTLAGLEYPVTKKHSF